MDACAAGETTAADAATKAAPICDFMTSHPSERTAAAGPQLRQPLHMASLSCARPLQLCVVAIETKSALDS
jgi:hypothetical protein